MSLDSLHSAVVVCDEYAEGVLGWGRHDIREVTWANAWSRLSYPLKTLCVMGLVGYPDEEAALEGER